MQDNTDSKTPENGEAIDAHAFSDPIIPIDFTPPDVEKKRRGFKLQWPHFLVAGFLLVAGAAGWFVLTAKSVSIQVTPITANVEVNSGFHIQVGQRYLMRSGTYDVSISNEGYYEEDLQLEIGAASAQDYPIELRELPGIFHLEVSGVNGPVSGANVLLDGEPIGRTPLRDLAVDPGEYELSVEADRYQASSQTIVVLGRQQENDFAISLEQAWAEVSFSTTPPGAEVQLNGQALGITPYTAEILQGEHEVTLKLAGHKA